MTSCQRSAVARGYTSSVLGRRRLFNFSSPALQALRGSSDLAALPDMRGLVRLSNREDSEALRQAGNAPIQVGRPAAGLPECLVVVAGCLLAAGSASTSSTKHRQGMCSIGSMCGCMQNTQRSAAAVVRCHSLLLLLHALYWQGTSADILKVALLELHNVLTAPPWSCRILLTVHDSVVLEVPQAQWPAAAAEIARIMEGVLQQHQLHLKVDVKEGW
jgi:hypothetical protein